MSEGLEVRDDGPVRVLAFKRAPGNALTLEMLKTLRAEVERAGSDGSRALVVGTALPRYFSSGLDLDQVLAAPAERRAEHFEALLEAHRALLELPKPAVAAMGGAALLGGWIVAMACDWRILSSDTGKVALSEIRLGLSPTPVLIARLRALSRDPRVVKEMTLRGAPIRAAEALEAGLVDELAPEAEVAERALALARRLAKGPAAAYAAVKRALNDPSLEPALWRRSLDEFRSQLGGAEAAEGLEAMRAKRRPRWEDA